MSDSNTDTHGVKRSRQACLNCRRKKVKCHGERPTCSFCARLLQECVYPDRRWTVTSDEVPITKASIGDNSSNVGQVGGLTNSTSDSFPARPRLKLAPPRDAAEFIRSSGGAINVNQFDMPALSSWDSSTIDYHNSLHLTPNASLALHQPRSRITAGPTILPPIKVLLSTVDLYFEHFHDQPYCFFHEQTFRQQLMSDQLPQYLIFTVLAIASRFSLDPFFGSCNPHVATKYASKAWKEIVRQCFDCDEGMDYRLVQAATLLAIIDFTACKHETAWIKIGVAVSMAQALHMMKEPEPTLSFSEQEERRRTLWSIYLLDKMATCGRDRPSLFLDRTIDLQLPCSEASFWMSLYEKVVTLEDFKSLDGSQIQNMAPSALTIVLVSVLSQTANYAFKHNKESGQKPPWDHTSEYQIICSQLTRFETIFDSYGDIQKHILDKSRSYDGGPLHITESFVFSYVLYNLCHCLLQHPFLLRRRLEDCSTRIPTRFFAQAIESGSNHALALSRTLANATRADYKVSATMFGYSALVAGSINGLFQHSADKTTRSSSAAALLGSLEHLKAKSKYWKTSARMVSTLAQFSRDSVRYSALIDASLPNVELDPSDIERLYSLCDYGTMCSSRTRDTSQLSPNEAGPGSLMHETLPNEKGSVESDKYLENFEDFSGYIEGIIPQFFGHTNPRTMLDDFSFALGQLGEETRPATSHAWHSQG
ncbi:hypothetical protein T440DRAFT_548047 [Plenodomus tracheiphilus IPT5]|uniref:Zn(2)-C6 fungal-type domain-containing protein n=1 Tax=Plenodomus tracheiphilus IPT5 TaxID=1408161 RepID=A0A6A7ARD7_9PLEO|nr:hypothetical protein T440DRAFT_548047 [Plenodomus tracheiphilus IPT5]